jgi:virginiamycin B lyase
MSTAPRVPPPPATHRHLGPNVCAHSASDSAISEFNLNWDSGNMKGSTHEIVMNEQFIFVTGQNMDKVAKFDYHGNLIAHFSMCPGSGPHGLLIDADDKLWVSLEFHGQIVNIDQESGRILKTYDLKMIVEGSKQHINPAPHGIALDRDGHTIWFTGKRTSTIGRIFRTGKNAEKVEHYELPSLGAVPIYLTCTANNKVYGTELLGGKILQLSLDDQNEVCKIEELPMIVPSSFHCLDHLVVPLQRPIAVIQDPINPDYVWFTEEAGGRIGRIDTTTAL